MELREEIKSILKEFQVGAKYVETAVDKIINAIVRVKSTDLTAPPPLSNGGLLDKVAFLEKELANMNARTAKLEAGWGQMQIVFAPPGDSATPTPAQPTPTSATAATTPKTDTDEPITDEVLDFFRTQCLIEKDDDKKIVTRIQSKRNPNPYKPDGPSFRIVVGKGEKQKRFNNKKLYAALYEDSFPQV